LSIKMPLKDFIEFKKHLHGGSEESNKFPNYSYDTSRSLLFTEYMAGPLHEKLVSMIHKGLNIAESQLPSSIRTKIQVVRNQKFIVHNGVHKGSEKVPDLAFQVTNNKGKMEVKFVLEVGVAETYEKLIEDARLWLEGTKTVSLVMLVKLEETPVYKCPIRDFTEETLAKINFPPFNKIPEQDFLLASPFGPAVFKEFTWVGEISGFFEFWKLDPVTKLATCISTRMVSYSLRDLIDIGEEHDKAIYFDWKEYLGILPPSIKELAVYRCSCAIRDIARKANGLDSDYQQPSQAGS
ncbi:hypothetical protein B9Z19DRAFT_891396, partial [Tuber borchii]